jgi:predicted negative regulator of RcsB-dependent stress response
MGENIYAVLIAVVTGITGTAGWQYWQRKLELKREGEYSYKIDCRYRIEKLEDELNKAYKENEILSKKILDLSIIVAELRTRIELMENKSK